MKSNILINVPQIEKNIKEKHGKFIKSLGGHVEKVVADQRLMIDIIFSRIYRVLICFRETKIIDEITFIEQMPLKTIRIYKIGYNNYVHIITNGHAIMLEGHGFSGSENLTFDMLHLRETINGVDSENYNWTDFSMHLLDYIHSIIYERKSALDTKINSIMKTPPSNACKDTLKKPNKEK